MTKQNDLAGSSPSEPGTDDDLAEEEERFFKGAPPPASRQRLVLPGKVYVYRKQPSSYWPHYLLCLSETEDLLQSIRAHLGGGEFRLIFKWRGRARISRRVRLDGNATLIPEEIEAYHAVEQYLEDVAAMGSTRANTIARELERSSDARRAILRRLGFDLRPERGSYSFPLFEAANIPNDRRVIPDRKNLPRPEVQ